MVSGGRPNLPQIHSCSSSSCIGHVKIPWLRLVQLLDEELHAREALELGMVKIDRDRRLDEPGQLYWFSSWLMHSGRNHSGEQERIFLLTSQRFDEDTRRLQGSIDTPT